MKIIKIKTIAEAKEIVLPPIPKEFLEEGRALVQRAGQGMGRHSVLRRIYELADKIGDLIFPHTVCAKGCSACCNIPVFVTRLEASYIERNTNVRMTTGVRSSITKGTGPCPLLSESGSCSVYQFRPFVCRAYAAFDDPQLCAQQDVLHVTYEPSSNPIFKDSASWILALNGNDAVADIRNFFKRKL